MVTLKLRKVTNIFIFCPSIGQYILSAEAIFFESTLGFSYLLLLRLRMTMITCSIGRHYLIVVSSHLKTWLVKIHFDFRIEFSYIHDEQFLHLCHHQPQYQALRKNQRLSLLNYLILLLLMIFLLYFKKTNILVLSILFLILFLILIYHPHFAHLFLFRTHARFPRMCQKHYLLQVRLRRCRRR